MIREETGESRAKPAYTALKAVLDLWQGEDGSKGDVARLQQLIDSDKLLPLWQHVCEGRDDGDCDVVTKLLLAELFDVAKRIPPWQKLSASKKKKRLEQIKNAAERLSAAIAGTPVRYLSDQSLDDMGLQIAPEHRSSDIRRVGEPDFLIAAKDVQNQVKQLLRTTRSLGRPSREDAHRRYFILRISGYVQRRFRFGSNQVTAELARIMLKDGTIDSEDVRKTLDARASH